MNEIELAKLYALQLEITPRLEFDTEQTKQILGISDRLLRQLKREGELQYSRRGKEHVFNVLDIYAFQQSQRDKQTFKRDQVAA